MSDVTAKLAEALRDGLECALELVALKGEALGPDNPRLKPYKDAVTELRAALAATPAQAQQAEALRKYKAAAHLIAEDAGRFQWMKDHALAIDTVADPDNQVQIWHGTDPALCTYGKTLSEAVDAAMKEASHG